MYSSLKKVQVWKNYKSGQKSASRTKKVQVEIKMDKTWFLLISNSYFVEFQITFISVWWFAIIIWFISKNLVNML